MQYDERRFSILIGVLKFKKNPACLKEKPTDPLFKMPSKKDIKRKADSLISRLFPETLKENDNESMNENDTVDDDFATGLAKAVKKSKSEKTFDRKLSGIGKEMVLFESYGTRSKNLEKLLNALLTICPT